MWHFLYSRYALSLVVIGILANRIQHVCRPRSRPARLVSWKRLLVRLPALLALAYVTVSQGARVLQLWSAAATSDTNSGWLARTLLHLLPNSMQQSPAQHGAFLVQQNRDKELMWLTHLAACISVATDTLVRTLEGVSDPSPSFNLVGFALTIQAHTSLPHLTFNVHYFLFVFLQIAEVFTLALSATFQRPPLRRLSITTFFGLTGILHWVLAENGVPRPLSSSTLFFVGFDRLPELCLMAVIGLTVFLHALTILLTEAPSQQAGGWGTIDWGRLVFSSSNLPSRDDDFSLALCKLGTACLQSTRQSGLSREMVAIEVPERTYVEVDDDVTRTSSGVERGARVRVGLDGLIKGPGAEGMHNEIRMTIPREGKGADGSGAYKGGSTYESALLLSPTKWREVKRFLFSLYSVLAHITRALYMRFIRPILPRCPAWIRKLPRWARLAWHGQNGEREREVRLQSKREEEERKKKLKDEALKAMLERNGVRVADGEDATEVAWRVMRERNAAASSSRDTATSLGPTFLAGGSASTAPSAEELGIDARLWNYLRRSGSQRGADLAIDEDEDESDEDWTDSEGEDEYDLESVTSIDDGEFRARSRSRSRSRSVFSPTPTPEDVQDPDESLSLLQLARLDFDPASGAATHHDGEGDAFSQVLLAHVSSREEVPLTRARYRALLGPGSSEPTVLASSSSAISPAVSADPESQRLRDVLLARRRPHPPSGEDEDEEERSRRRLCVVCCYEERTVLFWPCRCLALCDGCREELASRPGAKGGAAREGGGGDGGVGGMHHCPTCRAKVRGFSRVYLP